MSTDLAVNPRGIAVTENAAKRTVLNGRTRILTGDLVAALAERPRAGAHLEPIA